jgi:hypothetical protein
MRHGAAAALLHRQAGLGAIERLYLALFIDRENNGMRRRVHVEPDDVSQLGGKLRVVGQLEQARPMRLQAVPAPDALHRTDADALKLGHGRGHPVRRLARRINLGRGDDASRNIGFHLRMLRSAIERGPEELQLILKEVLDLPARKQKELATLLQETTLSAIITAAKTVADRLKFISALETIVFDPETKGRLKERTQLHKILAENTWVFGEEYNLWVSDRDLRRVLEKHRDHLDPDISIDEPVKVIGKKRGIVDLMFSRVTRRHRANDIEHMIVELKAPKVKIGAKEITQAKQYAIAVTSDELFSTVDGVTTGRSPRFSRKVAPSYSVRNRPRRCSSGTMNSTKCPRRAMWPA